MESIKEIFKIGYGPSSSHTMGPGFAAKKFYDKNLDADYFTCELFGSLALTGKGHLTDKVIYNVLKDKCKEIIFNTDEVYTYHPNAMKFKAFKNDQLVDEWLCFSVGGGDIRNNGERRSIKNIYKEKNFSEIINFCSDKNISLIEYINSNEMLDEYFVDILQQMQNTVRNGLKNENVLPGSLKLEPRAKKMLVSSKKEEDKLFAYALAASEENSRGNVVVTAPTCGSCGVLASIIYNELNNFNKEEIIDSLKVAGLIGNIIKTNASISGAEVGCQGEIGVACSMAAAAYCFLYGGTIKQIEYSAEIALEHHLGMTCDPIGGYVQIPCIERNAMSSAFAINAAKYALATNGEHYVSFDHVVEVMKETGHDLHSKYKETSIGGLAKFSK